MAVLSGCGEPSLSRLESVLRERADRDRFALAYSGGLDSRFLAHAARRLGFEPVLLHVVGPHVPPDETGYARDWAAENRLSYAEVPVDPLDLPLVAAGDRRRCYACKRELFSRLKERTDLPLCDGTNASDAGHYRPGLQAVRELGVLSPLALADLDKAAIRSLAARTGMAFPEQPPRPCLLTRLAYGMKPERETLAALAAGERAVRRVFASDGLSPDFRLRLVAPGRAELHVLSAALDALPSAVRERLSRSVPGLPPLRLVGVDTLSGFFDRVR